MTSSGEAGEQDSQFTGYPDATRLNGRVAHFDHGNSFGRNAEFDEFLLRKSATHDDAVGHRDFAFLLNDCPAWGSVSTEEFTAWVGLGCAIEILVHGSKQGQVDEQHVLCALVVGKESPCRKTWRDNSMGLVKLLCARRPNGTRLAQSKLALKDSVSSTSTVGPCGKLKSRKPYRCAAVTCRASRRESL
jgi:hypothetical protein